MAVSTRALLTTPPCVPFHPPTFPPEAVLRLPSEKEGEREEGGGGWLGALAEADTPAFSSNESQIP